MNIPSYLIALTLLLLMLLVGCGTVEPGPTPTPTLPPGLLLPPTPTPLEIWPALPAHLYFLREGRVWHWPAAAGTPQPLSVAEAVDAKTAVIQYRLSPDNRHLIYVTDAGELYRLDLLERTHTHLPTSGRLLNAGRAHFAITPDSATLLYIAWDVQPTAARENADIAAPAPTRAYGTLISLDLMAPRNLQDYLGFCEGTPSHPCTGFTLAPDGSTLIYADQRGLWQILREPPETPPAEPPATLLAAHPPEGRWRLRGWTGDSQWLWLERDPALVGIATYALLHVETGALAEIPHTDCTPQCHVSLAPGQHGLWLAQNQTQGGTQGGGCLYQMFPGPDLTLHIAQQICHANHWTMHPAFPHILPDGWPAFAHGGCGEDCPGPAPGLYFLEPEERLLPVALLPEPPAHVLWTADGSAFITFSAEDAPAYLGVTDGGFWDIAEALAGGSAFQWITPPPAAP